MRARMAILSSRRRRPRFSKGMGYVRKMTPRISRFFFTAAVAKWLRRIDLKFLLKFTLYGLGIEAAGLTLLNSYWNLRLIANLPMPKTVPAEILHEFTT